ncbi:HAD-IA family hydrolase [Oceanobacillus sp. J11TS1]|uniref:HAD-IA family hydrolase n=1 Tax=Oceanobacillus sp. J11TS1 TaxID=2807191 RepID=UPI001B25D6A4|nr:HAD-IA family hydrolase [Oceanobacillus sp. J11TS1]GIO25031.1 phosphoglycolate phosphatase [Oceanobacillus sp. J11TS1]
MYRHIIWDFDGTLFDTYPVMAKVFRELLKEQGIEEPVEEILKQMKVSASFALSYYEKKYQIDNEFVTKYKKRKKEAEFELSKPFEGIEEICKYIHSTNRQNYLLTHRGESSIELLKLFGLYDYFSDFITSKQGFERKPSPDAINYLINKYNMIHSEAIMIGDRDLDLLSGKNAGISACYFTDGQEKNSNSDYIINNFQQLCSIV